VKKVTLSADPIIRPNDYVDLAIHKFYSLAFIKEGQTCWTYIETALLFMDVMFYKGLVYGVSHYHGIVSFNLDLDDPYGVETIIPTNDIVFHGTLKIYFVKSLEGDPCGW
jgi:hypothetical protein